MTDPLKVYLAGSSDSMPRCQLAVDKLRAAGLQVVSTWLDNVAAVGVGNPRDASEEQRFEWSRVDLEELASADLVWFVVPSPGITRGAWVELGTAYTLGKTIVCSGDTKQSIFCALGHEFADDDAALDFVVKYAGCRRLIDTTRIEAGLAELRDAPAQFTACRFCGSNVECEHMAMTAPVQVAERFDASDCECFDGNPSGGHLPFCSVRREQS